MMSVHAISENRYAHACSVGAACVKQPRAGTENAETEAIEWEMDQQDC